MDEDKLLQSATRWQTRPKKPKWRLGDGIYTYMQNNHRAFEQNAAIVDIWKSIVPSNLEPFCRLDKRVGNVLFVEAVPGPYMHQMNLLAGELLARIKQSARRSGIQKIRVVPMQTQGYGVNKNDTTT